MLEWFDVHGGGVSAFAAILTAVVAIITLIAAGQDSRRRSQPMIVAELRYAPDSDTALDLVVRNAGPTVARHISVEFEPPLDVPPVGADGEGAAIGYVVRRYENPIPMMGPGQELSNTWYVAHYPGGKLANAEPAPERVTVRVKCRGIGRRWLRWSYPIDDKAMTFATSTTSSSSFKGRLASISNSLESIARAVPKRTGR
ncbi:hypothetical protein [Curtobacterium citreum]|uniref:hypothetical protein n=1 Tax=Curtobacterium citreum TaxID=2036 RepID=UPI00142EB09F|nr:hypothetical protein [Curtobacterium citreum]